MIKENILISNISIYCFNINYLYQIFLKTLLKISYHGKLSRINIATFLIQYKDLFEIDRVKNQK